MPLYLIYSLLLTGLFLPAGSQTAQKTVSRNGKTAAVYATQNGKPEGSFTQYYPNGLMQCQGTNGSHKKTGEQYWYYPNDKLKKIVEYSITYTPGHFGNMQFLETVTEFWENGKNKSVIRLLNNREQTERTEWYSNGNLKRETKFAPDQKHYLYSEFFENGQKKNERPFLLTEKISNQDGTYRAWNDKGIQVAESNYINNKSNGLTKFWTEEGKLIEESLYADNTIVAQKKWTDTGKLIIAYDKRDKNNTIEHIEFHEDKKTIRNLTYHKKYQVGDSMVKIRFNNAYDKEGNLKQQSILYNKTQAYGWGKNYRRSEDYWGNFVKDSFVVSTARNSSFEATLQHNIRGDYFSVKFAGIPGYTVAPWYREVVSFPAASYPDRLEHIMKTHFRDMRKRFTTAGKVNPEYLTTKEQFDLVVPCYVAGTKHLFFTSTEMISSLDSNYTGHFTIYYKGSGMRYEGCLKEGLQDSTATLYLDDSVKLSEKEFHHGLQHGRSKEWFINGSIASEAWYSYNAKTEETEYYIDGGKKIKTLYNTQERATKQYTWYPNGILKCEKTTIVGGDYNGHELKDEWFKDGSVKQIAIYKDQVIKTAELFPDGQLKNYNYVDIPREIHITRLKEATREYITVKLPPEITDTFKFDFEKNSVHISGMAYRTKPSFDWHLEDNFGKKTQTDRNVQIYSENLPCECTDFKLPGGYRMSTKEYISQSSFLKYQLNFHKPLDILSSIGGNPFPDGNEPERHIPGKKYDFSGYFNVYEKDVVIPLTDSAGILFSLSPCRSKYAAGYFHVYGDYRHGFPGSARLTITDLQTLSLSFNKSFLRQTDENHQLLKNSKGQDIPGMILFKGKKITYDAEREIDIIDPQLSCTRPLEITGTGIVITIESMLPDLSTTINYNEMERAWENEKSYFHARAKTLGIPASLIRHFRGAYVTSASVEIPYAQNGIKKPLVFYSHDMAIGDDFIIGTISIPSKKGPGNYSFTDAKEQTIWIDEKLFKEQMAASGFDHVYLQYDAENAQLYIHFYYRKS
jgi:antitoxin component YwqK of YwqJK toxin-antitoxin module